MYYIYLLLAVGLCVEAGRPSKPGKPEKPEKPWKPGKPGNRPTVHRPLGFLARPPRDCYDIQQSRHSETGVYTIYPDGTTGVDVRCDLSTLGGGWTVIQRRVSDSDFYKTWVEYQTGFGNLASNFWLGNEQIHAITKQGWYELRVEMANVNGSGIKTASYNKFEVGGAESQYKLIVDGFSGGGAGDSLTYHHGKPFTTWDRDNDASSANCATSYSGAWWYGKCHLSNLNGDYGNTAYAKGLTWHTHTGYYDSVASVEMKVRKYM